MAKPLLNRTHVENRLAWAQENLDCDWSDVVFIDESSFWAWYPVNPAWSIYENPVVERTVKQPMKVNVWGCFDAWGFGTLCVFTDNLNAEKMVKIYERGLLTSVGQWFGDSTNS